MITAYNPLTNPQISNSPPSPAKLSAQTGQISPANSNFFASVITQLLLQMELQSETDSGMGTINPALQTGNTQALSLDGMTAASSQTVNPLMTQMTGAYSPQLLNLSGLFSNMGVTPYSTSVSAGLSQNPAATIQAMPAVNPYQTAASVSQAMSPVNPYQTAAAVSQAMPTVSPYQTAPTSGSAVSNVYPNVSLQYRPINPSVLNQVLGGKLQGMGSAFAAAGKQYNVDPALLVSIARHETGNGTSQAAYEKNNIAGMMGANGLQSYASVEDSINDMARNIGKYYLGAGLSSIPQIGAKYAPVGAGNDPSGLNNYWVTGVTRYYNQLRPQTNGSPAAVTL